jgi:hypothetical protein
MSRRTTNIDPAKFRREAAYAELIYDLQTTAGNSTDADLVKVGFDSIIFENYQNLVRQKKSWVDSGSGGLPSE